MGNGNITKDSMDQKSNANSTTSNHNKSKSIKQQSNGKMNGQNQSHSKSNPKTPPPTQPKDGMIIFKEQFMKLECDGKTCLSLERVHYVLRKYEQWRAKSTKSLGMYRYINNG